MAMKLSFTKYEHQVLPGFRDRINLAESSEDVRKFFAYTVRELLESVFEGRLNFDQEDVKLLPESDRNYEISASLLGSREFQSLWEDSDLPHVINRLAEPAKRRFRYLEKQTAKTEAKIRR